MGFDASSARTFPVALTVCSRVAGCHLAVSDPNRPLQWSEKRFADFSTELKSGGAHLATRAETKGQYATSAAQGWSKNDVDVV